MILFKFIMKAVSKMFGDKINETFNKDIGFKEKFPLNKRFDESSKILCKYPNRIPIIVERGNQNIKQIDRKKYLVPKDLTVGQFIFVIRERMKLDSSQSIYIFVNDCIPIPSALIIEIYDKHKDEDNFLYITYCAESTFG